MTTFYPALRYRDAPAAIDWLQRAFGFEPKEVHENPDGTIAHAELSFGDGLVMLGSAKPDMSGERIGLGSTYVAADGIDELHDRAVAAGAEIVRALEDTDYGSRDFTATDPEGNTWSFGTYRP
jgi:uncharacterized glyoxalase superfamily protein PhnB